jgi:hypothetical protein
MLKVLPLVAEINITSETFSYKTSIVLGTLSDGCRECYFCLEMYNDETVWSLQVLDKDDANKWLDVYSFPVFTKWDYYNRKVITYIIDRMNFLLDKAYG